MILGKATALGTQSYASTFPTYTYKQVSQLNWQISGCGFGGYRIEAQNSNHLLALQTALTSGVNVIDTSNNYSGGDSERLIGHTLATLQAGGTVQREQVVIVSKGGYLQGDVYKESQARKKELRPYQDLVIYQEGLEHCIHPEFLAEQIENSLLRLQVECIDVYLLHNPEYYLAWASKLDVSLDAVRDEYYRRIAQAFEFLETMVNAGKIQAYGISSNTFVCTDDDVRFTNLTACWEIAESIRSDHHFKFVQLPCNLLESEGLTRPNQPNGQTVLQYAKEKNLFTLTNRPLNVIVNSLLIRLADGKQVEGDCSIEGIEQNLRTMALQEQQFGQHHLNQLNVPPNQIPVFDQLFTIGALLLTRWKTIGTHSQWVQFTESYLLPRLNRGVQYLSNPDISSAETIIWLSDYVEQGNKCFKQIGAYFTKQDEQQLTEIKQWVQEESPEWIAPTMSRTAIRALRSAEEIDCILVGMRSVEYVEDILPEMRRNVSHETNLWAGLNPFTL